MDPHAADPRVAVLTATRNDPRNELTLGALEIVVNRLQTGISNEGNGDFKRSRPNIDRQMMSPRDYGRGGRGARGRGQIAGQDLTASQRSFDHAQAECFQ